MCRGLDEQVELFRNRPLEGEYPYLSQAADLFNGTAAAVPLNPAALSANWPNPSYGDTDGN